MLFVLEIICIAVKNLTFPFVCSLEDLLSFTFKFLNTSSAQKSKKKKKIK